MRTAVRNLAGAMAALAVCVLSTPALEAQAPTVLMFYGGALKKPVFVAGADSALFGVALSRAPMSVKDLGERPYVQVALFWASRADPADNGTRTLAELTPAMAWQHGRYYPAAPGKPAILLTTKLTKHAQPVPLPAQGEAFVWGGAVPDSALAALNRLAIVPAPSR